MNVANQNWLVACDLTEAGRKIVEIIAGELKVVGGNLSVVHVFHAPIPSSEFAVMSPEVGNSSLEDQTPSLTQNVEEQLRQVAVSIRKKFPSVTVETFVREGDSVDEILDLAKETKVDRIVVGTHGRQGVERFFLGSVAEKMVRLSPIDVLVLKSVQPSE